MTAEPPEPYRSRPPFRPARPVVIGLVGGVAAGKSTVAGLFAGRGLRHVDADRIAREVAAESEVRALVTEQFGRRFVTTTGLDRPALAQLVFDDPAARARLEAILHPRIRRAILSELDEARGAGESSLLDAPLLLETGLVAHCDRVVFVDAAEPVRRARARSRGWADDELARREQNQMPVAEKRRRADEIIANDGALTATADAVDALLARLQESSA